MEIHWDQLLAGVALGYWTIPAINRLCTGLADWKEKRIKRERSDGYHYAAGVLLSGEKCVMHLKAEVCGQDSPFDSGVRMAIRDAIAKGLVKEAP